MKDLITIKRVGNRLMVLDALDGQFIGSIRGDAGTGYRVRLRGSTTRLETPEPIRVVEHAARLLYLEYLFTLNPTTTTGETS